MSEMFPVEISGSKNFLPHYASSIIGPICAKLKLTAEFRFNLAHKLDHEGQLDSNYHLGACSYS